VHITSQINLWKTIIDFNVGRGALIPESIAGVYQMLSGQIWMTMDFWLSQRSLFDHSESSEIDYKASMWTLLIPWLHHNGHV
jgi:hypothetical protein